MKKQTLEASAKKSLGQNFLVNQGVLERISTASPVDGIHILEVGPGHGALTEHLISTNFKSFQLIELDDDLIPELTSKYGPHNIKIHHGDVLESSIHLQGDNLNISLKNNIKTPVTQGEYSVFGNIPYYITSPILRHFMYGDFCRPKDMVILMQKEVANKILIRDGKHGVLSLMMHYRCDKISKVMDVSAGSFRPIPKVGSTVLKFELNKTHNPLEERLFLQIIKSAFAERRKTLGKNLKKGLPTYDWDTILSTCNIDPRIRAEMLELTDWRKILTYIKTS